MDWTTTGAYNGSRYYQWCNLLRHLIQRRLGAVPEEWPPSLQLNHIEVEWQGWKVRINCGSRGIDYEFRTRRGQRQEPLPADIAEQFDDALAEINLGEYLGNLIGGDGKI